MSTAAFALSKHAALVVLQRGIDAAWIGACLATPDRTETDRVDPALRHAVKRIEAADGRVLRVVYNPALNPPLVVTAFLDRSMKGKL